MKVDSFVAKAISKYPLLYYKDTYEASKFSVLHHVFIVLGNGFDWAYTQDSSKGGYLTELIYHKDKNDEWVQDYNKDYGEENIELDSRFWKEQLYELSKIDKKETERYAKILKNHIEADLFDRKYIFESEVESYLNSETVYKEGDIYLPDKHTHIIKKFNPSSIREEPYPNFSKRYSCFWVIDPNLIQKDWLIEGIKHLEYWKEYFEDIERYNNYHYIINGQQLKESIEKRYKNKFNWVHLVRQDYDFIAFDGSNYDELASHRNKETIKNTRTFINETLIRLKEVIL